MDFFTTSFIFYFSFLFNQRAADPRTNLTDRQPAGNGTDAYGLAPLLLVSIKSKFSKARKRKTVLLEQK
ncbi:MULTISPECIES: hypothetical protein [Olivibacter]|uniref:Secreted protein n=1 Tax=Olivibacter jilunii TaxID=985016 RepID=A0ABW6B5I2_9SPHI